MRQVSSRGSMLNYHATLLRLFGFDHTKLTYKRNGLELSLTDNQPARIVQELIG
jgi:hypothetical protein